MHEVQSPPTRPGHYEAPVSLDEVFSLMARHGDRAMVVAGGSDLLVELDRGAHAGVEVLIDLTRVAGLDNIETTDDGGLRLGALVTHNQVVADPRCVEAALPLAQACLEVGSPQLRNRATVVGNVVTASPANDTIAALMVLGAQVEINSSTRSRTEAITEFIRGFRRTSLDPGELVTAITIPPKPEGQRAMFAKAGLRRAQAISVVNIAAAITFDDNIVVDAALTMGSVAATVVAAPVRELLVGRPLDETAIEAAAQVAATTATPIDDIRSTADYRTRMVKVMVRRTLQTLASGDHTSRWPDGQPLLWSDDFDGTYPGSVESISLGRGDVMSCTVNGHHVEATARPDLTLLDWLREEVSLTGAKEGCAEGECGACTVHLDGAAVMSCLVPAPRASGTNIVTVEGLADDGQLHAVQSAFAECGAVQCGFCTPGLLMSSAMLLDEVESPSRGQIKAGLAGNLCRCTGYVAIETAVSTAAATKSRPDTGTPDP
ncbi:MAG: 2Fe-2S iron-sulfur cluster binding domain-containing protein [Actinomycetia bacterium]|nr:2Fe-2S iron-sulfur cluster binding domain-containing protein [Actinomycetes bacterium]